MNYQNIYNQIVERAKTRQNVGYVEKHHIMPKCLGGSNEKENLIELTAREHFLCHMLLCEIYPNENKLKYALFLMNIGKQKHKNVDYKISSRTYERLKIEHSLFLIGKQRSFETKEKISSSLLGRQFSEKTKQKISENRKGIKHKNHLAGQNHKNYGVEKTEEHKQKMSESAKLRGATHTIPHTEETKNKLRMKKIGFKATEQTKQNKSKAMIAYWERRKNGLI
jgi:hypothetical protein